MDASAVAAHGWAVVDQAIDPAIEAAADVPIEMFASAAGPEPELADPRAGWGHGGALPTGVAATTAGGSIEIAWFGSEDPTRLLGTAFTADSGFGPQTGRWDL